MDTNSANKKLLDKTFLYIIGNFGSKILNFIIVPLYSYYIDTNSMGYYDVIITTMSLLQPVIMLQMTDGVYRWLIETSDLSKQKNIISTVLKTLFKCFVIFCVLFLLINNYFHFKYAASILLLIISHVIYAILQQISRGVQKNKLYTFCGILYTAIMLSINCIGLLVFNLGIEILIISQIIANLICSLIIVLKIPIISKSIFVHEAKSIRTDILKYSIPLIPTTICWWLISSSDRYIILRFLGASANGIYSMSNKFPTILSTITNIFYLAWQESAILEYNTPHRNVFFSNIFQKYSKLLFSTACFLIPATKIYIIYFLESSYKTAWYYSGFLYLGVIFNSLSSFLGLGYQISKETSKSLYTTIIASIINVFVNISLVNFIGLQAASLSTFVAYLILFVIRIFHTKSYYSLDINWKEFLLYFIVTFIICIIMFISNLISTVLITILFFIGFIILNKSLLINVFHSLLNKLHRG